MKINVNQIPAEGLVLEEEIDPAALALETEIVKFCRPLNVKAAITKITNALTAKVDINTRLSLNCGRCLDEFEIDFKKSLQLNYPVDKAGLVIDLDSDIREEVILDYPLKPLCKPDCQGLCPKCGKNLNQGGCSCGIT